MMGSLGPLGSQRGREGSRVRTGRGLGFRVRVRVRVPWVPWGAPDYDGVPAARAYQGRLQGAYQEDFRVMEGFRVRIGKASCRAQVYWSVAGRHR